jgi:hypothetical protein
MIFGLLINWIIQTVQSFFVEKQLKKGAIERLYCADFAAKVLNNDSLLWHNFRLDILCVQYPTGLN